MRQAESLIGVREATNHNDGPVVETIQASTGNSRGDPWCASFNFYCYALAGYKDYVPRSAWSPDWVFQPTWTHANGGVIPKKADTFGIYFPSLHRVAHTGLINKWGESTVETIEGNTNNGGSREGDGVYRKWRFKSQIYAVRSWFKD